jgi:hypothetical protein
LQFLITSGIICAVATKNQRQKILTKALTKRQVAAYAVFLLGGAERAVDTEDIAVRAAELLPGAFSWRKYPEQINLELVRAVLSDSKKPQFGGLLHGTGSEGWRLSNAGVVWATEIEKQVRSGRKIDQGQTEPWAGSSDARRATREVERVKTSLAWQQWKGGLQVTAAAAMQLFRIDDYSDGRMRDIKVARMRRLVSQDPDATNLIEFLTPVVLNAETDR